METKIDEVGSLKPGKYVLIDGIACVVKDIQISKPGKHESTKARVEAIGLVDEQKRVFVKPTHDRIEVPIIDKRTAQVLSIHGESATVMDMETYETFDIKIPEDLKDNLSEGKQVLYWVIMKEKIMKQLR